MEPAPHEVRYDAIAMIEADHDRMKRLFDEHQEAEPGAQPKIAERLLNELELHVLLEERVFYPALEMCSKREGRALAEQARRENAEMKTLIAELRDLDPRKSEYASTLRSLRDDVEHHMREEEEEMLPLAERVLSSSAEGLGETMNELKLMLM